MRLSGDVYSESVSVTYNDAPAIGLANRSEMDRFVREAMGAGWRLVREENLREDWTANYELEVEEAGEGASVFASKLPEGQCVAADREQVLVGAPMEAEALFCTSGFGREMVLMGDRLALTGYFDAHAVAYLYERVEGEWRLEARFVCPAPRVEIHIAMAVDWLFVGMNGVMVFRKVLGAWSYQGALAGCEDSSVAAIVCAEGRLLVSSGEGVLFEYGVSGSELVLVKKGALSGLPSRPALALRGGVMAVGDPYRYERTGGVELYAERDGVWESVRSLGLPDGRMGDEFGASVALHGESLLVAGRKRVWAFPLSGI